MEKKNRPVGIWVVSILNIGFGSLMMLASLGMETGVEGAFLFGLGSFGLIVGIGLISLKPWARYLAIGGYILNVIVSLAEVDLLGLIIASAILTYLFTEKIKVAFARTSMLPVPVQKEAEIRAV